MLGCDRIAGKYFQRNIVLKRGAQRARDRGLGVLGLYAVDEILNAARENWGSESGIAASRVARKNGLDEVAAVHGTSQLNLSSCNDTLALLDFRKRFRDRVFETHPFAGQLVQMRRDIDEVFMVVLPLQSNQAYPNSCRRSHDHQNIGPLLWPRSSEYWANC